MSADTLNLRDKDELNYYPKNLLNLESFILKDSIFNISALENKLNIPATTLQKHIKRKRQLPDYYYTRLRSFFESYGFDNALQYYTAEDWLCYRIAFFL